MKHKVNFSCAYQPLVDLSMGEVIGCEVLARYEDKYGIVKPDVFVRIIEDEGFTWDLTEFVMEHAFSDLKVFLEENSNFIGSVNFYPIDLEEKFLPRLKVDKNFMHCSENNICLNVEVLKTTLAHSEGIIET